MRLLQTILNWTGKRGSKGTQSGKSYRPQIENLEHRILMAADITGLGELGLIAPDNPDAEVTLDESTGILLIDGSDLSDEVFVATGTSTDDDSGTVRVTVNSETYTFGSDEVNAIHFHGNRGNDSFENATDIPSVAYGGTGHDTLIGGRSHDALFGQEGNDRIEGRGSADKIDGGSGNDALHGGRGGDRIVGGSGNDRINGGHGADQIQGNSGNDRINGGNHNDRIHAGPGDDVVSGGNGNDSIFGGRGNDTLFGNRGNDFIAGQHGNDVVHGGTGNDV